MSHEIPDGQISGPSLGHLSPQGVPMEAFLRAERALDPGQAEVINDLGM